MHIDPRAAVVEFIPVRTDASALADPVTRAEPRGKVVELWPNAVDLAKRPDVLYRLRALLDA